MNISRVGYALVFYLALIEAISLWVLSITPDNVLGWFLVGFVPAVIVILLYNFVHRWVPIRLSKEKLSKIPLVSLSIANGVFIVLLFYIQIVIVALVGTGIFEAILGFFSVFLAFLIMLVVYNVQLFKISIGISGRKTKLNKINWRFSVYAGIFEFFILPIMVIFYAFQINPFANGLISGIIGSVLALLIVNFILKRNPLEIIT